MRVVLMLMTDPIESRTMDLDVSGICYSVDFYFCVKKIRSRSEVLFPDRENIERFSFRCAHSRSQVLFTPDVLYESLADRA
jgi:hypothetical protein